MVHGFKQRSERVSHTHTHSPHARTSLTQSSHGRLTQLVQRRWLFIRWITVACLVESGVVGWRRCLSPHPSLVWAASLPVAVRLGVQMWECEARVSLCVHVLRERVLDARLALYGSWYCRVFSVKKGRWYKRSRLCSWMWFECAWMC